MPVGVDFLDPEEENRRAAIILAMELSQLNLNPSFASLDTLEQLTGSIPDLDLPYNALEDTIRAGKKSQNMTECVPVPSSEHVAEIVGRQGCKIKALRAKTNTYIKTPVRGEEPVFVVTGRKEDVAKAKKEIQSAAEHFSQIRASRKNNLGGPSLGPSSLGPDQVTILVRVPYRVVGLVVGPKGGTIKRIQSLTNTYIQTPSRDKEPIFEVTGTQENTLKAQEAIMQHIANRTNTPNDNNQVNLMGDMLPTSYPDDNELFMNICKTGMNNINHFGNLMNCIDLGNDTLNTFLGTGSVSSSAFSSSGSVSSSSSSSSSGSGHGFGDKGIWSTSVDRDEGFGGSPGLENNMWSLSCGFGSGSSNRPSPTSSTSPTDSVTKRECGNCFGERDPSYAVEPCGHFLCEDCAISVPPSKDAPCMRCLRMITRAIRIP